MRFWISNGVYVNETGNRQYMVLGTYINEVSASDAVGIAWFEPIIQIKVLKRQTQEAPAFGQLITQAAATVPQGWFQPSTETVPKIVQKQQPAPAVALTPDTLPPKISGMGWFIPPDGYEPRRFYHPLVILQDANSFGLVFIPNPPAAPLADRVTFTFNFGIDF